MSTEERVKLSVAVQEKFDTFDPSGFDARLAMHVAAEWIDDLAALNNGQGAWRALTDRLRELAGPALAARSPETGTAAVPTTFVECCFCDTPTTCASRGCSQKAQSMANCVRDPGSAPEPVKPPATPCKPWCGEKIQGARSFCSDACFEAHVGTGLAGAVPAGAAGSRATAAQVPVHEPGTPRVAWALSDLASLARLTGMTNNIQQGASGVVIRFLLNADETSVWGSRDWKAAAVRGEVKRQARNLFRDTGRRVLILASPDENGQRATLWSSDADPVCEQMRRSTR